MPKGKPKVLWWGVVCSDSRMHYYRTHETTKRESMCVLGAMPIEINRQCGPHRVVPLVEAPRER